MTEEPKQFTDEQFTFVGDLLYKAEHCNEKTKEHSNVEVKVGDHVCYLRVDDKQLFTLVVRLIPNVFNYFFNVLPTLTYPFIVAYLQDLSDDDQPITVNDLFDMVQSLLNLNVAK